MSDDPSSIDLVIQTASGVLTGRFAPREAVTILAAQAPQARAQAAVVAERAPQRGERYAELLRSIAAELAKQGHEGREEPWAVRAVVQELERVVAALTG
ncbi:MAG TPA: hypothetical protein VHG90_03510 [Acidimicrobiales bacterium]|nr:hypothetical protein [Acidimicrobiales bacterium]